MKWLPRTILFYVVLGGATLIIGLMGIGVALVARDSPLVLTLERTWARILLRAAGVRVEVRGRERLAAAGPAIYMVNHQSYIDVFCVAFLLPVPFRMVAKRELFRIPLFGQALRAAGHVKVDRADRVQAIASLQAAARQVRERSISLVVFPEGTRSRTGELGSFKKGGFHLALQTGCAIVPMVIRGSLAIWPKGRWTIQPGQIRVAVGPPIGPPSSAADGVEHLMEEVRSWMEATLEELDEVGVARA